MRSLIISFVVCLLVRHRLCLSRYVADVRVLLLIEFFARVQPLCVDRLRTTNLLACLLEPISPASFIPFTIYFITRKHALPIKHVQRCQARLL